MLNTNSLFIPFLLFIQKKLYLSIDNIRFILILWIEVDFLQQKMYAGTRNL